ncbi:Major pollen allergen Ole e 10 [Hibiscus syriacus]|uniref:Major pollen allergen Ole e 10 n=1 Tax=Hibiscus syriacus TaxID=106335 RepID=A0A6A3C2R2_HIBSY|nr:major pollen allergen Ole e 10-like [Hibiscus syriacus]KAE8723233.1 Major pollen allergen Ole e 10 [Hibiscus syriacus]
MKSAEKLLALAFLHLALSSLLCFAARADTRRRGNGRNQNQKARSGGNTWCIAKPSTENARLNININYSCSQSGVDCRPIQPGGICYRPKTIVSHASYAMNLFYKAAGKNTWNCHFNGTGITVSQDPSVGSCNYPM